MFLRGYSCGLFFHAGTLAFDSILIALLGFIRMVLLFVAKQLTGEGNDTGAWVAKCFMCYVVCFKRFMCWMLELFNALGQFVLSYMVSQWYGTPYSDGQKSDGREKRKSKRKSKRK